MSGRGGIYSGPYGEKLYGDGREVEGVERVTDDAPARVEPIARLRSGLNDYLEYGENPDPNSGRLRFARPAAQPAKHTDDRPAETIPDGEVCGGRCGACDEKHRDWEGRTGRAEAARDLAAERASRVQAEDTIAILKSNEGSQPYCGAHFEDWFVVKATRQSERKTIDAATPNHFSPNRMRGIEA